MNEKYEALKKLICGKCGLVCVKVKYSTINPEVETKFFQIQGENHSLNKKNMELENKVYAMEREIDSLKKQLKDALDIKSVTECAAREIAFRINRNLSYRDRGML